MNDSSAEGGDGYVIDGYLKKDKQHDDRKNKSKGSGEGYIIDGALKKETHRRNEASWIGWLKKLGRGAAVGSVIGVAGIGGSKIMTSNTNAASSQEKSQDAEIGKSVKTSTKQQQEPVTEQSEKTQEDDEELFDIVFHDLTPDKQQEARVWVDEFKERIKAKPGYEQEHRTIPQKYKEIIAQTAEENGLPFEMLYGIIAIESGGGEDVTNQISGARGVAQFLPDTARQYGLIVEGEVDQRSDPKLSIKAAGKYLRDHMDLLGNDVGLTMWSYHAGIGNVYNALDAYSRDKYGKGIGNYGEAIINNNFQERQAIEQRARELIKRDKLDYYKLISNPTVKSEVINHLDDFSETYVPSILAILQIEEEKGDEEFNLGNGLKVQVPKNAFPSK